MGVPPSVPRGDAAKGKPDGERKSFYRLAVFPTERSQAGCPQICSPKAVTPLQKGVQQEGFPASRWAGSATGYRDPCGVFQQMAVAVGQGGVRVSSPKSAKGRERSSEESPLPG